MTKNEFLESVRSLHLPLGKYIVFGSGPLHMHGIRETRDIDIFVTSEIYKQFKDQDWEEKNYPSGEPYLAKDNFELVPTWDYETYHPDINQLIQEAEIIDGIPFAQLKEVRAWKRAYGREKDLKDIELIDKYLASQN